MVMPIITITTTADWTAVHPNIITAVEWMAVHIIIMAGSMVEVPVVAALMVAGIIIEFGFIGGLIKYLDTFLFHAFKSERRNFASIYIY